MLAISRSRMWRSSIVVAPFHLIGSPHMQIVGQKPYCLRWDWNGSIKFKRGLCSTAKEEHGDETKKSDVDVNQTYFPNNFTYKATSKPIVLRAIAGNSAITILKGLAWAKTGSSAMLSETIHSLVDTGNQLLLFFGLEQSTNAPDRKYQYGYGRAAYFWSLISAMGMFWLGAGVTVSHGVDTLIHPPKELLLSWEVWGVLAGSFAIDGWVLKRAITDLKAAQPSNMTFFQHLKTIKDPFLMSIFLEDISACTGVILASVGIGASAYTGNPLYDSIASISIGCLLGSVAISLIQMNKKYLLGASVDTAIERDIKRLLLARPSVDNVYAVQSQWIGPSAFSYKAEVDFDGTYLAAKLLEMYEPVFLESKDLKEDLPLILAWYAEDVTRLVEQEVKEAENDIRIIYPQAAFIELEPDSKDTETKAISNFNTKSSRTIERQAISRALADLARILERQKSKDKTT